MPERMEKTRKKEGKWEGECKEEDKKAIIAIIDCRWQLKSTERDDVVYWKAKRKIKDDLQY